MEERKFRRRWLLVSAAAALLAFSGMWLPSSWLAAQQGGALKPKRINTLIEILEQGKAAVAPADWTFIDMEHSPYDINRARAMFEEIGSKRGPDGRLTTTPVLRIPAYGDESPRWMVKQVLDSGGLSICFPQIDTKEQALRAIRSMRYPPQKGTKYPNPPGIRGLGSTGGGKLWGPLTPPSEYIRRADVWPLNPEGELFAMIMIESAEAIKRINEILDVPGIGGIFVGPTDVGMSLGVGPPSEPVAPELQTAFNTILKACKAKNVVCGISAQPWASPATRQQLIKDGWRIII
jgi:4-hydroxy-2-oxoheptanedioate aldolase